MVFHLLHLYAMLCTTYYVLHTIDSAHYIARSIVNHIYIYVYIESIYEYTIYYILHTIRLSALAAATESSITMPGL